MQAQAEAWLFAQFRLEPKRRVLLANGATVVLSSRAFDILEFLVANRDRVVARDELVTHVWRGVTVGENNLAVQLSGLRRALADHCGGETLIVSLPGRGYRFVADVTTLAGAASPFAPAIEPTVAAISLAPPARWPRRRPIAGMLVCLLVVLVAPVAWRYALVEKLFRPSTSLAEARLSIAVDGFTSVGDDPRTPALASFYTDAVLAQFGIFEDLILVPKLAGVRKIPSPHFELAGNMQITGADAVVTTGLTDSANGRLLYHDIVTVPVVASKSERFAEAMRLLVSLRPILFEAEFARWKGPSRDSLDLLVASHVAFGQQDQVAGLSRALGLAEQAVQRDPASRPGRVLLSLLLTEHSQSTSARRGDAEGRRALSLIDGVLLEKPRNFLYIARRAYTLVVLKRLDEAQATAEVGLSIEPGDWFLTQTLGETMLLKGEVAKARALLGPAVDDAHDDMPATLAFSDGRYEDAVGFCRKIVAAEPGDWFTQFTLLLEVAALSKLGNMEAARSTLLGALASMPAELRSVSSQRQTLYGLPDDAWRRFQAALRSAGMPP